MKHFFKTFWQSGLAFGFFMGVFFSIIYGWQSGIWLGIFAGALFGLLTGLFVSFQSNKFTQNRPLSPDENLVKEGPANYKGNGGWIYLTDSRLFYVSHKFNINNYEFSIPLSEIKTVEKARSLGVIPNLLLLSLRNGQIEKFVVQDVKSWVNQLRGIV